MKVKKEEEHCGVPLLLNCKPRLTAKSKQLKTNFLLQPLDILGYHLITQGIINEVTCKKLIIRSHIYETMS